MNNTFLTWLVGAAIAGLGLFLLLGAPAGVPTAAAGSSALTTNGASPASEPTYWKDVTPAPMAAAPAAVAASAACPSCGTAPVYVGTVAPLAAPAMCSSCEVTSSRPATAAAPLPARTPAAAAPRTGLAAGCGLSTGPCAETPCRALLASCALGCGCEAPCGGDRPRINRNGPVCVDECSFVQLYSTVPLPVCSAIHFAWAATRGQFLDPAAAAPIYYAPGTAFPGGEDVLVTLTVTDAQGNEYTDQIKLRVNNSR
jgi:hypothetical protein